MSVAAAVQDWKARLDAAWAEACWWEGIDKESKFVVFSDDNPGARKHNELTTAYFAWIRKERDGR